MQSQLKILFIDDHPGLRDSLSYLLEHKNPSLKFYLAGDSAAASVCLKSNPDIKVALVDLNLDGEDGLELIDKIRTINGDIKIIIYTMFNDPLHIKKALQKNIQGFVTKDSDVNEIEKAIISVEQGNLIYCREAQPVLYELLNNNKASSGGFFEEQNADSNAKLDTVYKNYRSLTKKEQEVFMLLAKKFDVYEIAEQMNKSVKTIQNKKTLIYQKMNIKDRLELVETAKLLGVLV